MVQPSTVRAVLCNVTLRLYCRPATHSFLGVVSPALRLAVVKSSVAEKVYLPVSSAEKGSVASNDCGKRISVYIRDSSMCPSTYDAL